MTALLKDDAEEESPIMGKRILLLDDDEMVREAVYAMLYRGFSDLHPLCRTSSSGHHKPL